jgi:thiamine biosynthesis lipoprotein
MGTVYSLYLYASSAADADAKTAPVFQEIDRLEDLLSNYRDSSELSRINREAGNSEVTTDPETFKFLQTSLAWSAQSDGAFDITVGKLMKAWGFFKSSGHHPTEAELSQVRRETGWKNIRLDPARRTVHFLSPGIELDPGGIGKGYAVERAVAILRSEHVAAALLSAGSSTIYALGAPPGKSGWKIRVPALGEKENILSTIVLRDTSLSTANCSEKHFIEDQHLYCHIMNPHTLQPVEGMLQVTVIAPSATDSDALSNVLFVSGASERASTLKHLPKDSALIIEGTPQASKCEFIRWPVHMRTGYCSNQFAKISR